MFVWFIIYTFKRWKIVTEFQKTVNRTGILDQCFESSHQPDFRGLEKQKWIFYRHKWSVLNVLNNSKKLVATSILVAEVVKILYVGVNAEMLVPDFKNHEENCHHHDVTNIKLSSRLPLPNWVIFPELSSRVEELKDIEFHQPVSFRDSWSTSRRLDKYLLISRFSWIYLFEVQSLNSSKIGFYPNPIISVF